MKDTLFRAQRGVLWYLKQATGEAKWDEYVERCAREGTEPSSSVRTSRPQPTTR